MTTKRDYRITYTTDEDSTPYVVIINCCRHDIWTVINKRLGSPTGLKLIRRVDITSRFERLNEIKQLLDQNIEHV